MTIFINENGIKKQLTAEEEIAFNKEIEKARMAQAELEAYKKATEEFLSKYGQHDSSEQKEEVNPYDPDLEEEEYKDYEQRKLDGITQQEIETIKKNQQAMQHQQYVRDITNTVAASLQNSQQSIPDVLEGYNHYVQGVAKQLSPFVQNEQELAQQVNEHMFQVSARTAETGVDPASWFYTQAKEVYGYQGGKGSGKTPKSDLSAVSKNKQKSVTMSGSGDAEGGPGRGVTTVKSLMSQQKKNGKKGVPKEEFYKMLDNIRNGQLPKHHMWCYTCHNP